MPYNTGEGLTGGLGGAATGATIGSAIFPGIGTAIGAGLGGLAGLFSGIKRDPMKKQMKAQKKLDKAAQKYFKKYGKYPAGYTDPSQQASLPQGSTTVPENGTSSTITNSPQSGFQFSPNIYEPAQQETFNYLLNRGRAQLENPYEGFEPIEQHARSKFQSESLPSIAERFSALGGSATRGSSDLLGSLSGAQSEFDQGIAALRAQYGLDNQSRALDLLRTGLTPQRELNYFPEQPPTPEVPSTGQRLLEAGAGLAGSYLAGGGDFGIGKVLSDRKKRQEQESIVNKILNQRKVGSLVGARSQGGPQAPQINTFAQLLALKRLQKGA